MVFVCLFVFLKSMTDFEVETLNLKINSVARLNPEEQEELHVMFWERFTWLALNYLTMHKNNLFVSEQLKSTRTEVTKMKFLPQQSPPPNKKDSWEAQKFLGHKFLKLNRFYCTFLE